MHYYDELVNELSELCGVVPEYWDIFGKRHVASLDTKKAILRAMRINIDTVEDIAGEIHERKWKTWKSFIDPVHVISVSQPLRIPVYIPVRESKQPELKISWSVVSESGGKDEYRLAGDSITVSEQQWIDGIRYIKVYLADKVHRDIGYHVLSVECTHPERKEKLKKKSKIIVCPDSCYIPASLQEHRAWGLSVNLYSIRSRRNWGIGDFTDLNKIVKLIGESKGGFVGINPLHASPNTKPFGISPYSPVSRLYKNFIYLDLEKIPEVKESNVIRKVISSRKFKKELEELKALDLIDYEKAGSVKEKIVRQAFGYFYKKHYIQDTRRAREFKKYVSEEGAALESFAVFMVLREHMIEKAGAYIWQEWPEEYQDISGKAVEAFKKSNAVEILYCQYVQWLIDGQLNEVSVTAKNKGMALGLYCDLAIGSIGGGSDAWNYRDVIADGPDVGAPPDDFSPDGQKWGFPPLIPDGLKETGYELFIQTIRKNMKYAGALRIDHALGMFRIFWIPEGMSPKDGAYVLYPSEDLLRIIALESMRNRTLVIAEDLGTIGENVRETLKSFSMLSYRLFYFERNYPDPSFLLPERYPDTALCAVTTHDLPTIYGYWSGADLEARRKLGKFPDDVSWIKQVNEREKDKRLILTVLKSRNIVPDDFPSEPEMVPEMTSELCLAIYRYLALTPCKLLLVSLDDIIGVMNQQNMPGTVDVYPNWMQKTPLTLEEILKDKRVAGLAKELKKYFSQ